MLRCEPERLRCEEVIFEDEWIAKLPPLWKKMFGVRHCVSIHEFIDVCRIYCPFLISDIAENGYAHLGHFIARVKEDKDGKRYVCLYPWPKKLYRRLG